MTLGLPENPDLYLEDGAAATTATGYGQVDGVAKVFDIGSDAVAWNGVLVINVEAIDGANGNELYTLQIEGSDNVDFSGTPQTLTLVSVAVAGEVLKPLSTFQGGLLYRYVRVKKNLTGTTPSLKAKVWLASYDALDDLSMAGLTKINGIAAANLLELSPRLLAWATGSPTGGPNGDGDYPLNDASGSTFLVPCPAKAGFSVGTFNALPEAEPPAPGAEGWKTLVGTVDALFTANLFPARRTVDMVVISQLLGTEILPALTVGGLEGQIALTAVQRLFSGGAINPKMPPYNCKGDLQETRAGCQSTAGSKTIQIIEPMFRPADVGKLLYLSNAGPGGLQLETVIDAVVDQYTVTMRDAATTSFLSQRIMWGTDDTVGMRLALKDCEGRGLTTYGACCLLPPGMYLVENAIYYRLSAFVGYGPRISVLCAKPTDATDPLLYNFNDQVDFPQIQNIGINGMAYYQRTGRFGGMHFISVTGAEGQQLPQTDPCPFFAHIHLWDNNYVALYTYGRHSGTHIGVETFTNWGFGWQNASYDCNAMNFLAIGNWFSGYMSQSANCNLANAKISFNGSNVYDVGFGVEPAQANMLELGTGNQYTNCRLQESNGCNLWIEGQWNEWDNLGIDDTGCMGPAHGQANATPDIRAAVRFGANTAIDNSVKFKAGRAVHGDINYMTHAIYYSGDASRNIVDGRTRYQTAETTWPGITYTPIGTNSSGGLGATNVGALDRVDIHSATYGSL